MNPQGISASSFKGVLSPQNPLRPCKGSSLPQLAIEAGSVPPLGTCRSSWGDLDVPSSPAEDTPGIILTLLTILINSHLVGVGRR